MTNKQKDNVLLEQAYNSIIEAAAKKCSECGCNPSKPKEGCECEHHNNSKEDTVEEAKAKKAKPDYLDVNKNGDTKESMKKALSDKKKNPFGNKKKPKTKQ